MPGQSSSVSHLSSARTASHHPERLSVATTSGDSYKLDTPDELPFILVTNAKGGIIITLLSAYFKKLPFKIRYAHLVFVDIFISKAI